MWSRAARGVTPDYTQYGSPLRAAAEMDQKPDILHLNWNTAGEGHGTGALYLTQ